MHDIFFVPTFIDDGPLLSNTAIYSTLVGSVIFIIGLVLCLSYISWKKILARSKRMLDLSSSIAQIQQPTFESPETQSESNMENEYEEIDEGNWSPEHMVSDDETISSSSSTNKSVYGGTDIDGYLHSYHSLFSENNVGKTKNEESESISEDIDQLENKQFKKMSESVQEQCKFSFTKHQRNRTKRIPTVQDVHVV